MSANRTGDSNGTVSAAGIGATSAQQAEIERFKHRMLEWTNPVEYVNNMYSCHPGDDDGDEYFKVIFAKDKV